MGSMSFDSLARQAAAGGSLPGPLAFLSAPGMASLVRQIEGEGKKRGRQKTKRKQQARACPPVVDRCGPQGDECITILAAACAGEPSCLSKLVCCGSLSTCDSAGFFTCLLA